MNVSDKACLTYMQNWLEYFYPERPDIVAELQTLAAELQRPPGRAPLALEIRLDEADLWVESCETAQMVLPQVKASLVRTWDKAMYEFEARKVGALALRVPWALAERIRTGELDRGSSPQQIERIKAIWNEHLEVANALPALRPMYPAPLT